ncbi:serine/threonine protein kinase [Cladophialophora psammophila CBS 110553]|uniref:EKC/KEOPS complex subunit BUD32 n=1 Tax=Cladophialophora psammophila CBS 110553 TaxID=1182543 RepID=W9WTL6_9EURO|nr:serine/threonine protein kinase [Cladophialophora psammophila CBS 110553]EXJ68340.1 serine/threonine protein kinase [Cladophialophora psammophila CBS 110553]
MSFTALVQKRLLLSDEASTSTPDQVDASLSVDSQASLVALATQHDLWLFSGGVARNPSGLVVRVARGATNTVNVSRLAVPLGKGPAQDPDDASTAAGWLPGQKVAAKHLLRGNGVEFSKKLGSMAKEIRILGQQKLRRHDNLVNLIGIDWEGTHTDDPESKTRWPLLLMEYADCGSLTDFFTLDIDLNWNIMRDIAYDVASGLEALDDAGVTHGDLTFSNVLIFRMGENTFQAKLCDFGFAMINTDYDDYAVRQPGFTPPWDAPESSQSIDLDNLYKVDIYGYGLLVSRVFLHGGDPFEFRYQSDRVREGNSKAACIKIWKTTDIVVDIAKDAVRRYPGLEYARDQLRVLEDIFDLTLRTDPELRAKEYAEIKILLKPELADEYSRQRATPDPDIQAVAAAAAYQLALFYIQGLGCDASYSEAFKWLDFSARTGNPRAGRDLYRLSAAMGIPIPADLMEMVREWTLSNAIIGMEQSCEDLLVLDAELASSVDQQARKIYGGLGIDIFTPEIRESYCLDDPEMFVSLINSANELIPFKDIDGEGLTWLHYGASLGSLEVVERLMEMSLDDINCTTSSGSWTPLWMSCAAGNTDVVLFLLRNGADPRMPSATGQTCLHHLQAFPHGDIEKIATALLKAEADIEAKDHDQHNTPLHYACLRARGPADTVAIQVLLRYGADPCSVARDGRSPIDIAAMRLRPDLLHALLQSPKFSGAEGALRKSQINAQALSALIMQLKAQRLRYGGLQFEDHLQKVLNILISTPTLAAYVKAHARGHHPLQDACLWGSADMIEPLLSHLDIEVNPAFREGHSYRVGMVPLFDAIRTRDMTLFRAFLSAGADITARDEQNRNVLHIVAEFMPSLTEETITRLSDLGSDLSDLVNSGATDTGFTPFDMAVQSEHFDCARVLFKYGAKYDNFTRPGMAGEFYNSFQYAAGSQTQLSFLLCLEGTPKNHSLVVCDNGFTLFHLAAASFDNGK